MVVISCTQEACGWKTPDREAGLAAVLAAELANHTAIAHAAAAPAPVAAGHDTRKAPSIDRPKIAEGGTEETWSMFTQKWEIFKAG